MQSINKYFIRKLKVENYFLNKFFFTNTLELYRRLKANEYILLREIDHKISRIKEDTDIEKFIVEKSILYYSVKNNKLSIQDYRYGEMNKYFVNLLDDKHYLKIRGKFNLINIESKKRFFVVIIRSKFMIGTNIKNPRIIYLKNTILEEVHNKRYFFSLLAIDTLKRRKFKICI